MTTIRIPAAIVLALVSLSGVFSQTNTNPPMGSPHETRPEYKINTDRDRARQNDRVERVVNQSRSLETGTRRPVSSEERKAAEEERRRVLEEINRLLSVPPEYAIRHADLLRSKKTGLMRVFPDRGCDKGLVVSVANLERCGDTAPIRGAGSIFSFRLNKLPSYLGLANIHRFIGLSDLHFIDGKLVVGTESIQDIIADVGEVDLTDVTLKSDGVKFLRSFKPAGTAAKVALQNQELEKGINESGFLYSNSAPMTLDRTYVLRSIAFSSTRYRTFWNTDVITVFKVVGREDDGSIILLWRELKESKAPVLKK